MRCATLEVRHLRDCLGVASPWLGGIPEFCFEVNFFFLNTGLQITKICDFRIREGLVCKNWTKLVSVIGYGFSSIPISV